MKIRTLEQLEDKLYSEFAWRRDELRIIHSDFDPRNVVVHPARIRAAITVLYAHWEGGIKTMADTYVSFIKNQTVRYGQLHPGILGLLLRGKFTELEASSRFVRNRNICEEILQSLEDQAVFPTTLSVDTGSNLKSDRLVDILASIGIEDTLLSTKHVIIDALVDVRNDAAHGDNVAVDRKDFLRFYQPTLDALELFRDRLIQAGSNRNFSVA